MMWCNVYLGMGAGGNAIMFTIDYFQEQLQVYSAQEAQSNPSNLAEVPTIYGVLDSGWWVSYYII